MNTPPDEDVMTALLVRTNPECIFIKGQKTISYLIQEYVKLGITQQVESLF